MSNVSASSNSLSRGMSPTPMGGDTSRFKSSSHIDSDSRNSIHNYFSVTSNGDIQFDKPKDDKIIDELFIDLMNKRDMKTLPTQVIQQMLSYPAQKKWTMIQSDARQEYQLERKRATTGPEGDKSAPEWYVRRIVDGSISIKELTSLAVSLRTQPIGWVKRFLEMQGMVALIKVLGNLSSKRIKNDNDIAHEYEIVKCLKTLLNNQVHLILNGVADNSLAQMQPWTILSLCPPYAPQLSPRICQPVKSSPKSSPSSVTGTLRTATLPFSTAWTNSALLLGN